MLTRLTILIAAAAMLFPAAAGASGLQDISIRAARAYWNTNAPAGLTRDGGDPRCGYPTIVATTMSVNDGRSAEADIPGCAIDLSNEVNWTAMSTDWQYIYCVFIAHEWGHLVLGATYFAAVNPGDPAHSPDPYSLMSANAGAANSGGFAEVPGCDVLMPPRDPAASPVAQQAPVQSHRIRPPKMLGPHTRRYRLTIIKSRTSGHS